MADTMRPFLGSPVIVGAAAAEGRRLEGRSAEQPAPHADEERSLSWLGQILEGRDEMIGGQVAHKDVGAVGGIPVNPDPIGCHRRYHVPDAPNAVAERNTSGVAPRPASNTENENNPSL